MTSRERQLSDADSAGRDRLIAEWHDAANHSLKDIERLIARLHRRLIIWTGIMMVLLAAAVVVNEIQHQTQLDYNKRKITETDTAVHRHNFQDQVRSDKVCTEQNQGDACRALFDRVAASMTWSQRKTAACGLLAAMAQTRQVKRLRDDSHC